MIPVRTSPVPAAARAGTLPETTSAGSPGAAISVSAPLSRTMQPNRSTARRAPGGGARRPSRGLADQARELALVRREDRRRGARERLELPERVGVDDDRQVESASTRRTRPACRRSGRGRGRARPRASARPLRRSPGRPRRRPALPVLAERSLHDLEQARSRAPAATRPGRRRRRSRRRRGTRPRRQGRRAREPAGAADDEHGAGGVLVVAVALGAGRRARIVSSTSRCAVRPSLQADVGDLDRLPRGSGRARRGGRPSGRGT